jgi:hypothetical protein
MNGSRDGRCWSVNLALWCVLSGVGCYCRHPHISLPRALGDQVRKYGNTPRLNAGVVSRYIERCLSFFAAVWYVVLVARTAH